MTRVRVDVAGRSSVETARRVTCPSCHIEYWVAPKHAPDCPMCRLGEQLRAVRDTNASMRERLERVEKENRLLRAALDEVTAIREALQLVGVEDLVFLKTVCYRYRNDRPSISLQSIHGQAPDGGGERRVIGLLAKPRGQPSEPHICTSVGGVAIATCYATLVRERGAERAMLMLCEAIASRLPGGPT